MPTNDVLDGGSNSDISIASLLVELNRKFEQLNAENISLKEQLLRLQQEGGTWGGASSSDTSLLMTSQPSRLLPDYSFLSEGMPHRSRHDARRISKKPTLRSSELESARGVSTSTAFFPEWPLNVSVQGRSAMLTEPMACAWFQQVPGHMLEEIGTHLQGDQCLLAPQSCFRLSWDGVSCILLLVQLWLTPLVLAFSPETGVPEFFPYMEDFTTVFFMIDIVLNFNTGLIRQNDGMEQIIMDRRAVVQEYCGFFFWVDLISTVPFDKLIQSDTSSLFSVVRIMRLSRWLKLLRFLRLTRMLKTMQKFGKNFELEKERVKNSWFLPLVAAMAVLAILSHLHACLLQGLTPRKVLPGQMRAVYIERFTHVVNAFIAGAAAKTGGESVRLFYLAISIERLLLLAIAGVWLIRQAMLSQEHVVKMELAKEQILLYLRDRKVSHQTRIMVLDQLNDAGEVATAKTTYDSWIQSGIPVMLEHTICKELWLPRLVTLGLIEHVLSLEPQIKVDLVLIVREEVFPRRNFLFREGDLPLGAYLVLKGIIHANSSLSEAELPLFTKDMWVGEKALVSPDMVRTITCFCVTPCMLMAVPARGFRNVLLDHGVLGEFEDYCVQNLWQGICGRCGMVGDHFAHECPTLIQVDAHEVYTRLSEDETSRSQRSPREHTIKPDLKEFLRCQQLEDLISMCQSYGVRSLMDLRNLDPTMLDLLVTEASRFSADIDAGTLRHVLSRQYLSEFHDGLQDRARGVLGTSDQRCQHLMFLSHHKLDGGTEAALLRQELELKIKDDRRLLILEAPIFLDSEDLDSLETLIEHVQNSHNFVILLTNDVLTRPWCLVELVTAVKFGIPMLPVEVRKPGHQFDYPDAKFYEKLARGQFLKASDMEVLSSCSITLAEVERSLRLLFNVISLPYSPHRPAQHRQMEVSDILKRCDPFTSRTIT